MATDFVDVCRFAATSGGTGNFVVSTAVTGYQTPAAAGATDGTTYRYRAESDDLTQWEIGYGVYTSASSTLARTSILASTNAGSAVNFTLAPKVSITLLSVDLRTFLRNDQAQSWNSTQQAQGRSNLNVKPWTIAVISASNASWPVPANTIEMIIEVWGAGGSGAGGNTTTSTRGGGGAGGGYVFKHYTGTMDATLNVTIGAGGAAVASAAGGANGNGGGTTSVVGTNLGTLTGNGGGAGLANQGGGGTGGTSSGGDLNISGQDGIVGFNSGTMFGWGGDSPRGGNGGMSNVGAAGVVPGGGGAAGNHSTATNSGAGANGEVVIWTR